MPQVSLNSSGQTPVIQIQGGFVFEANKAFREIYQGLPAGRPVIIDLSKSDYIDSAGLGMLIRLREHAGNNNGSVTISGANSTVRTILEVANFGSLFKIT